MPSVAPTPLHDVDDESAVFERPARAKLLPRATLPGRRAAAAQLDMACLASGQTNRQIARAMGIDESTLRALRDGRNRVLLEHVNALPASVRDLLVRPLLADESPLDREIRTKVIDLFALVNRRRGT